MRRLLIGLAVLVLAVIAIVLIASRGEEPTGETERGSRGFPLRGSLADDAEAIDSAVAAWREEVAEDEAEEDDDGEDPDARARTARRPDPDDDIAVLWIGRVEDEDVAILQSQGGLLAQLTRREDRGSWFVGAERVRTENDFPGNVPIGVGDAVLTPASNEWRFVDAGYSGEYEDAGDGLLWSGSGNPDGFVLPRRASSDGVPIYVTGVGGRLVRPEAYEAFTQALEQGYERAVYLAAERAAGDVSGDEEQLADDDPPALSVEWTGEVPGYEHAALVLQGDAFDRRAAVLGYGDQPERSEDKDEGTVGLGTASRRRDVDTGDTFAAAAYGTLEDFPYLFLAGGGAVETVHALIGTEEIRRKAPLAVIDARRFDPKDEPDTVAFGRTASGSVVAPLRQR